MILWDKLEEIAKAIPRHKRIIVPSGHGVGKTFDAAHIVLWFLIAYSPSKVITTAPTWHQVKELLWAEIHGAYAKSYLPFGGTLTTTKLEFSKDWFAVGLSTKESAETREFGAQKFQGFHSPNLLVVVDEGAGVPQEIFTACESLIVSENNRILVIGNPSSPTGPFYEACKDPRWHKIKISCFDHPNVKEGREIIPGAVTKDWVEDKRLKWGEGSPLWMTKVLGEFPAEGEDTLIALAWAEKAAGNEDCAMTGSRRLAVDVARFGSAETVFCEMVGEAVVDLSAITKKDTMWTVGEIMRRLHKKEYDYIIIDDVGVGGGVTDRLEELGIDVVKFNGGSAAEEPGQFVNRRDETYWLLHEAFKPSAHGKQRISIPDDKELINQLSSIRYKVTSRGMKIESKDEMRKRGLKSPDRADALAMAYAYSARGMEDEEVGMVIEI